MPPRSMKVALPFKHSLDLLAPPDDFQMPVLHTVDFHYDPAHIRRIVDAIDEVRYRGTIKDLFCLLVGRKLWESAACWSYEQKGSSGYPTMFDVPVILCPIFADLDWEPVFNTNGTLAEVYQKADERRHK